MRRTLVALIAAASLLSMSPARAQETTTLRVAVVVEVAPDPLLGPDGQPLEDTDTTLAGQREIFERLARSEVPIALSVSPVFVEQLRLLGPSASRTFAALLRLVSAKPLLSRPRTDVQLPHLVGGGAGIGAIGEELRQGADAIFRQTDERPLAILHAPALDVSDVVLRAAREEKLSAALVSSREITDSVRAERVQLIPAHVSSGGRETVRLIDEIVQGNDDSVAVVLDDPDGAPSAIEALSTDERLGVVPITELLGETPDRPVNFPVGAQPPGYYWEAIGRARDSVMGFASYTPGNNQTRDMLEVLLDISRSSALWRAQWERATEYAGAIVDRVSEERALVSSSEGSVTLTSRGGTVPVTIINLARYPVRVRVRVRSPRLSFPDGATQLINVSPRGATLTFVAEAKSSGTFPMTVHVTSPDGAIEFGRSEVLVRSTAVRIPALVLTAGAALFLIAWSSRGFIRRRRP